MRAFILLLALTLGSPMVYAKGGPSPISAAGTPGVERCKEVSAIAKKIAANPDAMPGRVPRRLAMDAMRCARAEKEATAQKAPNSMFKKFLSVFGM